MQVSNHLLEKSFGFTENKPNLLLRSEEINALEEVSDYCKRIGEKIQYTDLIWNIYVEKDVSFADYLFGKKGKIREDDRRLIEEMLSKKWQYGNFDSGDEKILISLGQYMNGRADMKEYLDYRRSLLSNLSDVQEYEEFMQSCFPNSCFADNILKEMKNIENFPQNAKEITDNLSVLNDDAIELYRQYNTNLKKAMDILSAKLLECSPDPSHVEELYFPFMYEEQINGESVSKEKLVACSPHLKLIHKGSNLRIYFWWCDTDIGEGKKVLIGRIGRHPY